MANINTCARMDGVQKDRDQIHIRLRTDRTKLGRTRRHTTPTLILVEEKGREEEGGPLHAGQPQQRIGRAGVHPDKARVGGLLLHIYIYDGGIRKRAVWHDLWLWVMHFCLPIMYT